MGGWMPYGRMRNRNGLFWRPEAGDDNRYPDPYPRYEPIKQISYNLLLGDMNRMEQDYLYPLYPQDMEPPAGIIRPRGSSPSEECSAATGVSLEDVQKVLHYVFRESR